MNRLCLWSGLLAAGCLLLTGCGISFEVSPRPAPGAAEETLPPEEVLEPTPEEPAAEPPEEALPEEPAITPGLPLGEEPPVETREQE